MRLQYWLTMLCGALVACGGERAADARRGDDRAHQRADGNAAPAGAPSQGSSPASGGDSGAGSRTETRRRRVLIVGTSLTAGLGLDRREAYPALLARRIDSAGLSYEVVNAGVSGETSAGARERLDWLLREPGTRLQPGDVFVLETGANDGLRGLSVSALRANLETILARVRAAQPGAKLVVAGMEAPPNLGPRYTSEFRDVFPEVARRHGAAFIPFLLDGVAGVDSLNQADGIHPNTAGARMVADNVWAVLRPLLDGAPAPRLD